MNGMTNTHDGQGNSASGLGGYGAFLRSDSPTSNNDGVGEATAQLPVPAIVPEPRHAVGGPPNELPSNTLPPNPTRPAGEFCWRHR